MKAKKFIKKVLTFRADPTDSEIAQFLGGDSSTVTTESYS
jgi:hypothetical protein